MSGSPPLPVPVTSCPVVIPLLVVTYKPLVSQQISPPQSCSPLVSLINLQWAFLLNFQFSSLIFWFFTVLVEVWLSCYSENYRGNNMLFQWEKRSGFARGTRKMFSLCIPYNLHALIKITFTLASKIFTAWLGWIKHLGCFI